MISHGKETRKGSPIETRLHGSNSRTFGFGSHGKNEKSENEHKSYQNGRSTFSCYYIPHHAVIKDESKTTKTRIVFDASAKTKKSLNDILMVGATIQASLIIRVMKWRCYQYALRGDITKMYRQIKVYEEDVNYQRMVFRFNKNEPIQDFCLNTLTFGTASAPYMAIRSLKQVAIDNTDRFPIGSKVVQNDFHVDDLLTGDDSIEGVKEIWSQVTKLMNSAKFPMRKWSSNVNTILSEIPEEEREFKSSEIKLEDSLKTLGIGWLPIADQFFFTIPKFETEEVLTKRKFLSQASSLFDPLGWLGPAVMKPKIMFQKLWKEKLNWDERMQTNLEQEWKNFIEKFSCVEEIRIPRWFGFARKGYRMELHGFSDACEEAFGANIYVKTTNEIGNSTIELIVAKSRVAPIKKVRLPRLELCGGVLLANLIDMVKTELGIDTIYCWTDSSITLDWINSSPDKYKTFVANRIAEIQEFTEPKNWRHVDGKQNPADCLSRGIDPDELRDHKLWWHGPEWLKLPKTQWPRNPKVKIPEDQLELKGVKTMLTVKKLNGVLEDMLEIFVI